MKRWFLLPLLIVVGCVHINQGSATARKAQIEAHLRDQLHCRWLELRENDCGHFFGFGKNDSGPFAIEVTRQEGRLTFHGTYSEPAHGTFSGSASWHRQLNATIGFHKSSESSQLSLGTP